LFSFHSEKSRLAKISQL